MERDRSLRAVLAALAANVGIAIAKFVAFAFTGSTALLAESLHSVADTTDQGLLLYGRWRSRRRETPEHPFGYSSERYFWAFMVSILLFTLGSLYSLYEGVTAFLRPEPLTQVPWAFGVLLVALAFDGLSLRTAVRTAEEERSESWWEFVRRTKEPEVPVILLEDSGAVAGVLVAMAAVGLTQITGDPRWDAAGGIGIGAILGTMAMVLAREMKSLLIGEAASPEQRDEIHDAIAGHEHVRDVLYLRTMHLGPEDLLVETKVTMDPKLRVREVAFTIDEIEHEIRDRVPAARVVSIEPDVPRGHDPDAPRWAEHEEGSPDRADRETDSESAPAGGAGGT